VTEVRSPDGRWVAFARDHNLWVRSLETGQEQRLSDDGEPFYGYAVNDYCCNQVTAPRAGRGRRPILVWSPDSRRIATHRLDQRHVAELHLLETAKGRPVLHTYRYALPGDSAVPRFELHIFDLPSRTRVRVDAPPQQAVNTSCCGYLADTVWKDVRWGSDSGELFFTRGRRDFRKLELVSADASTGATRVILEEAGKTFLELNTRSGGIPNWRVFNQNREVIWFSERDGFGHLYLYDARSGALKNRITSGPWLVVDLLLVDERDRLVYFTAVGREPGRDPYLRHLYRASLDGARIELLTPEPADHEVTPSPSGRYFVDQYSRRDTIPIAVVRSADGRIAQRIAVGDVSRLQAAGWPWPRPFVAKARDGITDLYGYLYVPSQFDAGRRYPVIDYIYPGPQIGPIGFRSFSTGARGNLQALAELGFIVVTVDALGTPLRAKSFHDAYYGNMGDNGIADHVAVLKQLAGRHPQMDLDRVGIFGHSGGGFSSTAAILRFPAFFKVAVSSAGNHDNRSYDYTWGEKYQGLLQPRPDGSDNFDSQANQLLAGNLQGKLLLMYGTLDDNVHPNATLLLMDELIKRNKDFDLVVLPNRNHDYANEPYVIRRTWDYFVRHLLRAEPPPYEIKPAPEPM
jgi:dipeptidyl aminopeptidase/acylaminoacyl peptidase